MQPCCNGFALRLGLGPHTGVESVLGVVGLLDGLVDVGDGVDRHQRPEGLGCRAFHVLGDVGQQRRLVEQRADVGAGLAACDDGRALDLGVVDVGRDGLDLVLGDEAAHLDAEFVVGSEAHVAHPLTELLGELRGDRLLDVDTFDGDAELAGVGEAGPHGRVGHFPEVGTLGDDHRVLAAELGGESDESTPGLLGQELTGGGGAGEHDVLGVLDDGCSHHRTRAGNHGEQVTGQTCLVEQFDAGERAVGRLAVRLEHDAVACQQCRDGVGHREGHRVVPRGDDSDDALGLVPDPGLGQHGQHAGDLLRGQQLRGGARVVPRGHRDVENLFEGSGAGLARLGLRHVHQLVAVGEHQVAVAVEDLGALGHGTLGPCHLS